MRAIEEIESRFPNRLDAGPEPMRISQSSTRSRYTVPFIEIQQGDRRLVTINQGFTSFNDIAVHERDHEDRARIQRRITDEMLRNGQQALGSFRADSGFCVFFHNGEWHRGEIRKRQGDLVYVVAIDIGLTFHISVERIQRMRTSWAVVPSAMFRIRVTIEDRPDLVQAMRHLIEAQAYEDISTRMSFAVIIEDSNDGISRAAGAILMIEGHRMLPTDIRDFLTRPLVPIGLPPLIPIGLPPLIPIGPDPMLQAPNAAEENVPDIEDEDGQEEGAWGGNPVAGSSDESVWSGSASPEPSSTQQGLLHDIRNYDFNDIDGTSSSLGLQSSFPSTSSRQAPSLPSTSSQAMFFPDRHAQREYVEAGRPPIIVGPPRPYSITTYGINYRAPVSAPPRGTPMIRLCDIQPAPEIDDKDFLCPHCQEKISEPLVSLSCGDVFHEGCIKSMFEYYNKTNNLKPFKCPMCGKPAKRIKVTKDNITVTKADYGTDDDPSVPYLRLHFP